MHLYDNPVAEQDEKLQFEGVKVLYEEPESDDDDEDDDDMYECENGCGFEDMDITVVEAHEETCTFDGVANESTQP